MKPLYTKKNGTSQRVAAIEVKMPASYPSANVTYGSGSVEDALDDLQPTLGTVTKVGVTGDLYVTMFGKIGVISGYFFNESALSANTIIGTVPYTPLTNYVLCGTTYGMIAYIDTSGNIKIANEISSLPRGTYSIGGTFVTS